MEWPAWRKAFCILWRPRMKRRQVNSGEQTNACRVEANEGQKVLGPLTPDLPFWEDSFEVKTWKQIINSTVRHFAFGAQSIMSNERDYYEVLGIPQTDDRNSFVEPIDDWH